MRWLKDLSEAGYIPDDWVRIVDRTLSEEEAFSLERKEINRVSPEFNMAIRGENNHFAKLTDEQVVEIKQRLSNKELHKNIAADYGVSRATVSMIKSGRNWKHV